MKARILFFFLLILKLGNISYGQQEDLRRYRDLKDKLHKLDSINNSIYQQNPLIDTSVLENLIFKYSEIIDKLKGQNSSLEETAYWRRGCLYLKIEDYKGAIKNFNYAIELSKKSDLKNDHFINKSVWDKLNERTYIDCVLFRGYSNVNIGNFDAGCEDIRYAFEHKENNKWAGKLINEYCK